MNLQRIGAWLTPTKVWLTLLASIAVTAFLLGVHVSSPQRDWQHVVERMGGSDRETEAAHLRVFDSQLRPKSSSVSPHGYCVPASCIASISGSFWTNIEAGEGIVLVVEVTAYPNTNNLDRSSYLPRSYRWHDAKWAWALHHVSKERPYPGVVIHGTFDELAKFPAFPGAGEVRDLSLVIAKRMKHHMGAE